MNQLAAFFAQMTSPNTAAAGARVQAGAPQGDAFANILAQFQAALLNDANATVDPAAAQQQIPSTSAAQFLAQLPQSANLSTDDLAAQLKALSGTEGDTSKIDALLALLAPQQATTQPAQAQQTEAPVDTTLAGIIAALQQQIQTQAPQPVTPAESTASPAATAIAATPADLLRGTLPIESTPQAQQSQTPDAANAVDAKVVENAAIALILPPAARPKQNNEQPTPPNAVAPASAKSTSKQQPNDTAAQASGEQAPGKQTQTPAQDIGAQSSATPKPQSDQATPVQAKTSDASAPQQTSAVAAAPVVPTLTDAQHVTITAATAQTAVPLDALAVHIARKFDAGASQFEISLHPADLGQLDISLSVGDDGHVQAVLRAERPETLDLLQRDARSLEQQLRQAGLDVGAGALSFSLSSGNGQRQAPFAGWPAFAQAQDADGVAKQQAASTYIAVRQQGGVDIRV